ncbi:unnamed protein product [Brassica oleracea var. botrytis]
MEQQQLVNSEIRRAETRVSPQERVPIALRLGDHSNSPTSQARIPASQRLGPVMDAEPSKAGEVPMKLNNEEARMGTKQTKELTRGEASMPAGSGGNSQSSDNIPFKKKHRLQLTHFLSSTPHCRYLQLQRQILYLNSQVPDEFGFNLVVNSRSCSLDMAHRSRGDRCLKPSQKLKDMAWFTISKKGRRGRGGTAHARSSN